MQHGKLVDALSGNLGDLPTTEYWNGSTLEGIVIFQKDGSVVQQRPQRDGSMHVTIVKGEPLVSLPTLLQAARR